MRLMRYPFAFLPLFADAGVPMILITFPAMVILLIPVILIESFLCKKWLGLTTWIALKSNTLSNLASTLVGIPIAWGVMLLVEYATLGLVEKTNGFEKLRSPLSEAVYFLLTSAWVGPGDGKSVWIIPAAVLVLLIPFFFPSYGIEYLIVRSIVGTPDGGPSNPAYPQVRIAVRNANLVTYGLMFVATSIWLVLLLPRH